MVEPDQEVHQWLTQEAARYFASKIEGAELGSFLGTWGVDGIYADVRQATVIDGSRDEDKGHKPPLYQGSDDGTFDIDGPSFRHFCASAKDIYTGFDVVQDYDSALTQAGNILENNAGDNCVVQYAAGNKTAAYYYLGHVAHLIEDMTVPAHTHNDPHGSSIVGLHDSYEQDYAATNFRNFHYDDEVDGVYPLKNRAIPLPTSLYDAFYTTAEYTDDYDSNHEDGEFARSGLSACFFPADYPSATLHKPDVALRTGGGSTSTITDANCAIIAKDLMYWSMWRTAQLYRFFYHEVDTTPFRARVSGESGTELSSDPSMPSAWTGSQLLRLRVLYDHGAGTAIGFPASGIVKSSRVLHYDHKYDNGDWMGENTVPLAEDVSTFDFDVAGGTYKIWITAESGAGYAAEPDYRYVQETGLRIAASPQGGNFECGQPLSMRVQLNDVLGSFSYQWLKDGAPIADATADSFGIAQLEMEDAALYTCVVTDDDGDELVSRPAIVHVFPIGAVPAMGIAGIVAAVAGIAAIASRRAIR